MSFRWPEETTVKFVTKYVEHECLWNTRSLYYKNKRIRQAAYMDIQNAMNIPGFGEREIKMKIRNIRSTFSQEKKKIKESENSGAGPDAVYIPSLKWFSILDASLQNLIPILPKRENNLTLNNSHTDESDTERNSNCNVMDTYLELDEDPLQPPPKMKKIADLSNMTSPMKEIADINNSRSEVNEFDIFGKHVGAQLKSLPILLAIDAQEHIQLYLNSIRRQHLQNA